MNKKRKKKDRKRNAGQRLLNLHVGVFTKDAIILFTRDHTSEVKKWYLGNKKKEPPLFWPHPSPLLYKQI